MPTGCSRQILEPITMTSVKEAGQRFYRATGAAKGTEMLDRLGVIQAADFSGCGGPQSPKSSRLTLEVDIV